jgi:hypothetical protein
MVDILSSTSALNDGQVVTGTYLKQSSDIRESMFDTIQRHKGSFQGAAWDTNLNIEQKFASVTIDADNIVQNFSKSMGFTNESMNNADKQSADAWGN